MSRSSTSKIVAFVTVGVMTAGVFVALGRDGKLSPASHIPLGLDAYMPIPEDNPLTPEKVTLGLKLFHERRLSRDRSLSCSSCHNPQLAFSDRRRVSLGVLEREGPRNTPALTNRGYGKAFFWDGRTASLEEQVLQPVKNPKEMDLPVDDAVTRLRADREYPLLFQQAFGREVDAEDMARALASYVRTILSGDSPFDRFMDGERSALSEEAQRGLEIFRGKGNCTACHLGPNFTDERFHNTGVAWREGDFADLGRSAVTGKDSERGAFKTPTLREIARTAPYCTMGA